MATKKKEYVNQYSKPVGLGGEAAKMWEHIMSSYELTQPECRLVVDLCREIDLVNRLEKEWGTADTVVKGSQGQPVGNPIMSELAQHRRVIAGHVKQLRLETRKMVGATTPQEKNRANVVSMVDKWKKAGSA